MSTNDDLRWPDACEAWFRASLEERRGAIASLSAAESYPSMAAFVNAIMMRPDGATWCDLVEWCVPEAQRRGVNCLNDRSKLRQHARSRGKRRGYTVEMNDHWVLMTKGRGEVMTPLTFKE